MCFAHWLELPSLFSEEKYVSVISFFFIVRMREKGRERERKRKQNLKNRIKFDKDIADLNEFI